MIIERKLEIPRELKENCARVILHIDILYIIGSEFLTMIGHPMYYRTCMPLSIENANRIYDALDKVTRTCNLNKFNIGKIECDGKFKTIMERVKDEMDICLNYTNAQDHVPSSKKTIEQ